MKVLPDTASGYAHGKIILIGEHAVVHNEPAIAIPFTSANVEVTIEKKRGEITIDSIYHKGKLTEVPDNLKNLTETLKAVCEYFD
ncbi:MAG TPA: mevalonate kinase, partial [Atopostipes sp.]|nr:mevalonate kinase [Atopostipes sp.]